MPLNSFADFLSKFSLKEMEVHLTLPSALAAILGMLISLYSLLLMTKQRTTASKKRAAPPRAGGAWPVIGHLHLLVRGSEPLHKALGKMAEKHGPIFIIKMGARQILVVNNSEIAKECLTTNDRVFASRPKTTAMEILAYDFTMFGFSPYGHHWRQARKLVTHELLSSHRLEKLKHVREAEIRSSIKELYELWINTSTKGSRDGSNKVLVEMKRWFGDVTLNVISRIVAGKRCKSSLQGEVREGLKKGLRRFFELSGKFMVSDVFPLLNWLDIDGDERLMKKIATELDLIVQEWLDEHRRRRDYKAMKEEEDFMDTMLSMENIAEQFPHHDGDAVIKTTCLDLVLGGADTTMVALTWALSLLLNNQDVLMKARNELNICVGKERQVEESDIKNLVYLQAIFKETMRLYPAGPLSAAHESLEDCIVNGYHIPAGTMLLTNIWKIHRDPRVWVDPYEFRPERFLNTHTNFDMRGQNFNILPFGSGRRMCVGVAYALQVMHLTLASLLHGFDIETPNNEAVDMSEGTGLTVLKTTPLVVLLTPRLPDFLYG